MRRPPIDQQVTFLTVADLARSHAFYAGALGLDPVLDQGSCRIYRVAGEAFLGICEAKPGEAPEPGRTIVTLACDRAYDVDAWHDVLTQKGLEPDGPARDNAEYHIRHFFLADPDGHRVEVQAFLAPAWPKAGRSRSP